MKQARSTTKSQAGFTLVELSIVLVIIGLIIGGVLAGQDMIRAAEVRSTVAQLEGYNTAVNTFRDKYRNLPGDMLAADAARFGFQARGTGTTPGIGDGDGDRLMEADASGILLGRETALFWRDLSQAGLIGEGFNTATVALVTTTVAAPIARYIPEAKIGGGQYITIHSANGRNFYQISGAVSAAAGVYTLQSSMLPQTAFNIDDKMDDGNPMNGSAMAAYSTTALDAVQTAALIATPTAAQNLDTVVAASTDLQDCAGVTGAALPYSYNTSTTDLANRPACQLRIRASF